MFERTRREQDQEPKGASGSMPQKLQSPGSEDPGQASTSGVRPARSVRFVELGPVSEVGTMAKQLAIRRSAEQGAVSRGQSPQESPDVSGTLSKHVEGDQTL